MKLKNMKKIISIIALAAVVLGMASCNHGSNEPEAITKRFKITVEDITYTSAYISVEPPTAQTPYKIMIINKNLFHPDVKDTKASSWWNVTTGPIEDYKQENLFPGTKYVVAAAEVDTEGNIVGEIDYVEFQMQTLPYEMAETPNDEPIHFTGEHYYLPDNGFSSSIGKCEFEEEGLKLELRLYTIGDKERGHFTTDDLINYFIVLCQVKSTDENGDSEALLIVGADYTVKYNDATEELVYNGWVDMAKSTTQAIRLPFTMNCTEYVPEEEEEE